jgi:hypothetical protein
LCLRGRFWFARGHWNFNRVRIVRGLRHSTCTFYCSVRRGRGADIADRRLKWFRRGADTAELRRRSYPDLRFRGVCFRHWCFVVAAIVITTITATIIMCHHSGSSMFASQRSMHRSSLQRSTVLPGATREPLSTSLTATTKHQCRKHTPRNRRSG